MDRDLHPRLPRHGRGERTQSTRKRRGQLVAVLLPEERGFWRYVARRGLDQCRVPVRLLAKRKGFLGHRGVPSLVPMDSERFRFAIAENSLDKAPFCYGEYSELSKS